MTPAWFSIRTGHFRSSIANRAISRQGEALPWYTYPSIDFLAARAFTGRSVLEFGSGQSTLWWAARTRRVVAFEGNEAWFNHVAAAIPANVDLRLVNPREGEKTIWAIREQIAALDAAFDIVIIDGLFRGALAALALEAVTADGAIICDNAESYDFRERFLDSGLQRVDFIGHAPGVILPHNTSIFFRPGCFLFDSHWPIQNPADV